ncbi:hypothetical protein RIR_jg4510.t1 [Rhizophagus irregularis DAOM 181602=DAOM 197198]|nr:hypothetical protein RIR_jg4510.t1 [Rhizophagus irregularis DAOM 181602=DAOM 197198]
MNIKNLTDPETPPCIVNLSEPTYDPGSGSFTSLDKSVDIDEHQMFEIDNTQSQSPLNAASLKKNRYY